MSQLETIFLCFDVNYLFKSCFFPPTIGWLLTDFLRALFIVKNKFLCTLLFSRQVMSYFMTP